MPSILSPSRPAAAALQHAAVTPVRGAPVPVTAEALTDGWVPLMPVGEIVAADGRTWRLEDPEAVVRASEQELSHALVDYDHGADKPGASSEAAGWIRALSAAQVPGFVAALIEWTDAGRAALEAKRWRFISPTFYHDASGRVLRVARAALTNRPAIRTLPALADEGKDPMPDTETETESATESAPALAEALAELASLKGELAVAAELVTKASAERDLALAEVAALKGRIETAEREAVLAEGRRQGKIVPALDGFLAGLSLDQLKQFLATTPVLVTAAREMSAPKAGSAGVTSAEIAEAAQAEIAKATAEGRHLSAADAVRRIVKE